MRIVIWLWSIPPRIRHYLLRRRIERTILVTKQKLDIIAEYSSDWDDKAEVEAERKRLETLIGHLEGIKKIIRISDQNYLYI